MVTIVAIASVVIAPVVTVNGVARVSPFNFNTLAATEEETPVVGPAFRATNILLAASLLPAVERAVVKSELLMFKV